MFLWDNEPHSNCLRLLTMVRRTNIGALRELFHFDFNSLNKRIDGKLTASVRCIKLTKFNIKQTFN